MRKHRFSGDGGGRVTSVVSHPRPGDECDAVLVSGFQSREGDAESVHAAAVWGEGPGVQVRSRARSGCPAGRGRRGAGPAPAAPLGDPGSPAGQGHWALASHAPLALGAGRHGAGPCAFACATARPSVPPCLGARLWGPRPAGSGGPRLAHPVARSGRVTRASAVGASRAEPLLL